MSHDADMISESVLILSQSVLKLTEQMKAQTETFNRAFPDKSELQIALNESLRLQSHYADVLNHYDCGERLIFTNSQQWIDRLKKTGTIKREKIPLKDMPTCES